MPDARLTYNAPSERLFGSVDGCPVDLRALSGGHRGALDSARWQRTAESWDRSRVGGPTPVGTYTIYWLGDYTSPTGKRFGRCCFLHPDAETKARIEAAGRVWNDFLIHKPGAIGSEGCVIPWPMDAYETLIDLLEGTVDEPVGVLVVV